MSASQKPTDSEAALTQRKVLESMTENELRVESARIFRHAPADSATTGELIEQMLAKFKRDAERPRT
jgi:hypothetical protein